MNTGNAGIIERSPILETIVGAIIGDYYGSNYEFSSSPSGKAGSLESANLRTGKYTDDTVMTVAVMDALSESKDIAATLREYGAEFPHPAGGYGERFGMWLRDPSMGPYGSFGNGAAMRVSPVGFFAKSEEECIELSKKVTEVTHNSHQGIKGAEVVALCVYKAFHGASKEELRDYVSKNYDVDFDLEDLHRNYAHNETCQGSVPQALYCFLSSSSFEDCLRRVCYVGGDADTTGAIACAVASAYYKSIPEKLYLGAATDIPELLWNLVEYFASVVNSRN